MSSGGPMTVVRVMKRDGSVVHPYFAGDSLRAYGAGGVKNIDLSHDDANATIAVSSGNMLLAAAGGSALPSVDNSLSLGSSAKRFGSMALAGAVAVFLAQSDANPTSKLSSSGLEFGAGGGSALDVSLSRASAGVAQFGVGQALRLRGGTSGYVGLLSPTAPTSWTLTLPPVAPTVDGYVLSGNMDGTTAWAAAGAIAANLALSNLSGVAVNASLVAGSDASINLGSAAKRWATGYIDVISVLSSASDANPVVKVSSSGLQFGAGGGSAVDLSLTRAAAGVAQFGLGEALRLRGGTSGYVGLVSPAAPTSWTLTLPAAVAGGANYMLIGQTDGTTSWAAQPTAGADTALDNLASVAINASLLAGSDNSIALGSAAKRWTTVFLSSSIQVLASASDANAVAKLSSSGLQFGAGGGSAVDLSLTRAAAGVAQLGLGESLRLRGGTSGYVGLIAPAAPTSWTVILPTAAPSADGYVLTGNMDGSTAWIATGGIAADIALDNLSAVAINTSLLPGSDNAIDSGGAAKRFRSIYLGTSLLLLASASDANPTAKISSSGLQLGAGGATAVDVRLYRDAANILAMPAGNYLRIYGSSSGKFDLKPAAAVTDWALTFPAAAPGGSSYLLLGAADGTTSWAALSSSAADPALDNLASVAINASLVAGSDAAINLGSAAKRWTTGYINVVSVLGSASDANPVVKLSSSGLQFGAGGASVVDLSMTRAAAGVAQFGLGEALRLRGGTSGYVQLVSPAAPTSWTITLPTAAPAGNSYTLQGNTDGTTSWVNVASGADTALDNLASVAINAALVAGSDNSIGLGSAAKRWTTLFASSGVQVLGAASDAQPKTNLGADFLRYGSGGSSAVDVGLERDAAGVLKITDGSSGGGIIKRLATQVSALADGATIAWDWSLGNNFTVTITATGRQLLNPTNVKPYQICVLDVIKTNAADTLTTDTAYKFGTDMPAIALSPGTALVDQLTFRANSDGTKIRLSAMARGYSG